MRKKIAILTNLISPYRVPLFLGLGAKFSTTVAIGIQESNRPEWSRLDSALSNGGVSVLELSGLIFRRSEDRFLHINPGYLPFLLRERPDGVISFELGFRTACAVVFASIRKKPLWIWSEGTLNSEHGIGAGKLFLRRLFVKTSARWITFGEESTRYLSSIGVERERILQLQNGVDDKKFTAEGTVAEICSPRPLILVVGQLIERKGIDLLLQSIQRIQSKGHVFSTRIIGSGPRRLLLESLSAKLQLQNIEFLGGVGADDLPAQYRAADVLVFPTLKDVWGLVANEALLCGTPVICSKYAGCATDLLEDQDIFDPLDPKDLDRALLKAIQGEVGKPNYNRIWSMERIVKELSTDLEQVLCSQSK
jgi:glycosyltransferase involved in cell wall biosynthesis